MADKKILVAYFSASGVTQKAAQMLAGAAKADLYEIRPKVPYTKEDLDWKNPHSRSSVEMHDSSFRPAIQDMKIHMEQYDVVFVGFPIWWYTAPTIINTFLEGYDFSGKMIIPFATSGGSGMGKTNENLRPSCKGAALRDGRVLNGIISKDAMAAWVKSFNL